MLLQTIEKNNCIEKHEDNMDVIEDPNSEDFAEDDCDDIESKLIGRPLFIMNLDP